MTVEDLKAALDNIPKDGAINRARRLHIQKEIIKLTRAEKNGNR